MIDELLITQFRGISHAEFLDLKEINLFVGNNNSGKTSALEAIELFSNPLSERNVYELARLRERLFAARGRFPLLESIEWMFPKENGSNSRRDIEIAVKQQDIVKRIKIGLSEQVEIISKEDPLNADEEQDILYEETHQEEVRVQTLDVTYQDNEESFNKKLIYRDGSRIFSFKDESKQFRTHFVTPIDHRVRAFAVHELSDIIKSGDRPKVVQALQYFDKHIKGIELLLPDSSHSLPSVLLPYIDHELLGLTPITMFGDGLRKALMLASALIRCQNGILLIDELETAIHTTVLGNLFEWLVQACKEFNVQLFATTHSLEAVDAILKASHEQLEQLAAYRLEAKEGHTLVKRFSGKALYDLRYLLGQDVR